MKSQGDTGLTKVGNKCLSIVGGYCQVSPDGSPRAVPSLPGSAVTCAALLFHASSSTSQLLCMTLSPFLAAEPSKSN